MHVVEGDSAVIEGAEYFGLDKTHRELQRAASRDDTSYKSLRFWIRDKVERARAKGMQLQKIKLSTQPKAISLFFDEMNLRRNDISPAAENTCTWLFEHKRFSTWLGQGGGFLWIKGKPGAGKSTLMKYAFQNINRPDCPETEGKHWAWRERELQDFLGSKMTRISKEYSIRIFVDALDECGEEIARELVSYFLRLTSKLLPNGPSIGICFSCRHYPIVALDYCLEICIEEQNFRDIETYVKEELQQGFPENDAESLQREIVGSASGIFQWASLVVPLALSLQRKGHSLRMIHNKLREMPKELNRVYQEILEGEPDADSDPDLARSLQLMQWICIAKRPLSLDELRFAMTFDADAPYRSLLACQGSVNYVETGEQMAKLVKSLSKGLAEVKERRNQQVAQFIHESVSDYLTQGGLQSLENTLARRAENQMHQSTDGHPTGCDQQAQVNSSDGDAVGRAHYRLSRSCIKYFTAEEICRWSSGSNQKYHHSTFPLLQYAVTSWASHAQAAEMRGISQSDLLDYFQWPSDHIFHCWIKICEIGFWPGNCPNRKTTLLHIASRYGLFSVLVAPLRSGEEVEMNARDSEGRTALLWAAMMGHEPVADLLIEEGAELDSEDAFLGRTALSWAAEKGHELIVKLLAKKGAKLDSKDKFGRTALSLAARSNHESILKRGKQLVEKGAGLDVKDKGGRTALLWAAMGGHGPIVRLLAEKGADLNSKNNPGRTALSLAAGWGNRLITELLVEQGADLDSEDNFGQTALSWATDNGHESIVKLLIEKGATQDAEPRP
ncbi:hypothetical protein FGG08_004251 [Glutinoglossum americanum]|uniref:Nephrocystin 3-like N-terminal domain-containing protein n=1 Tax=Glutinoglossum americanum TaxID=1670608 RepID=A0A9P8I9J0_9PEZI|nr:hypothetical protein FGG08_004251 [Glutinoglossum americanum]